VAGAAKKGGVTMAIDKNKTLQFKANLKDYKPNIWRRFVVPADFRLEQLHDVLQVLFGWDDYHLRHFTIEGVGYGLPDPDDDFKTVDFDDSKFTLNQLFKKVGQKCNYEYDFGDGWEVSLVLEKVFDPEPEIYLPVCLDGKLSGPPEDVGGTRGYLHFLEAINDPKHHLHDQALGWIGEKFDPEAFNLKAINRMLKRVKNKKKPGIWEMDYMIVNPKLGFTTRSTWPERLTDEEMQILKDLLLRRDIVMILNYINENKVVGTAATGNFPQKVFRDMCSRFVNPPSIDHLWIDGTVIKTHSESEITELMFRHALANNGFLIEGKAGSRWRVTALGNQFLVDTVAWQYWHLLVTWWEKVNWTFFAPYYYSTDDMDDFAFTRLILHHLLSLGEGTPIAHQDFVLGLAEQAKGIFPSFHMARKRSDLITEQLFIKKIMVDPFSEFGILEPSYITEDWGGWQREILQSFSITGLGLSALESLSRLR